MHQHLPNKINNTYQKKQHRLEASAFSWRVHGPIESHQQPSEKIFHDDMILNVALGFWFCKRFLQHQVLQRSMILNITNYTRAINFHAICKWQQLRRPRPNPQWKFPQWWDSTWQEDSAKSRLLSMLTTKSCTKLCIFFDTYSFFSALAFLSGFCTLAKKKGKKRFLCLLLSDLVKALFELL